MKTKQQYKEFSERFREVMRKAKLDKITREAAAAKLGVSAPAVSYYWHGERIPRPGTAKKMAKKLKCDPDWLCTGKKHNVRSSDIMPIATSIELLEQIMLVAQELKAQQQHRERRSRNDGDRRKNK